MKEILIISLFLISIAYGQVDTTRLNVPTDASGIGYKVNTTEVNGRAVDGLRFFKMTGGPDTARRVMNVIYAQYAGVFGNGSDMTSRINAMYGRAYVNSVTYAYDTTTTITVSGTVTVSKATRIEKGVSFTGSGTFNFGGNILDADPDQVIFGPNITVTGLRTRNEIVPARWFGVTPNGSTDNKAFFDKAQAAATGYKQTVLVPRGDNRINSAFTQAVNFTGENGATVKFSTSSTATGVVMWTVNVDSTNLKNLTLDGSNKAYTIITIGAYNNITVDHCTVMNWSHVGSENPNTQGIYFRDACNYLKITNNLIANGTAPNSGICRGIRGAYAGVGPAGVEISGNTFKNIRPGNANNDADDICIQDYQNNLGMKIHDNQHVDQWKRAMKIQANGIEYYNNNIWSNKYDIDGAWSFAAISVYGNVSYVHDNTVWKGVFEEAIGIGPYSDGVGTMNNVRLERNRILMTASTLNPQQGIRVYGKNNRNITMVDNYIENPLFGIFLNDGGRGYKITGNRVVNARDYSYIISSANTYPDNWFYDVNISNNTASKGSNSAFFLKNISGGSFSNNGCDSTTNLVERYQPALDSVLNFRVWGNYNVNGSSFNYGSTSQRPNQVNANALRGLLYFNTDSNFYQSWQDGSWVDIRPGNIMAERSLSKKISGFTGGAGVSIPVAVDTGSYIPTVDISGSAVSSFTAHKAHWERIGDKARVWGTVSINTKSTTSVIDHFSLSLPIPSIFKDNISLSGSGSEASSDKIGAIRVFPFYVATPVTRAVISYAKTANTTETYLITYNYDYLINNN